MIKWVKKLLRIISTYDNQQRKLERAITQLQDDIRNRTKIHVDISPSIKHSPHSIILISSMHGKDFIQTYNLRNMDMRELIEYLRQLSKSGIIDRVDALPEVKACVLQDINW